MPLPSCFRAECLHTDHDQRRFVIAHDLLAYRTELGVLRVDCQSSKSRLSPMCIPSGQVHLWRVLVAEPGHPVADFLHVLSQEEHARAGRFHFVQDRERFVIGRGVLRCLLGSYLGREPWEICLEYGPQGKPRLAAHHEDGAKIRFNVSHSAGLVVYAFAWQMEVGVDVEHLRPTRDWEQMASQCLSDGERRAISQVQRPEQWHTFLRCWTAKEAYLKATGQGLSLDLRAVEVFTDPTGPMSLERVLETRPQAQRWTLSEISPAPDSVGALVVERPDWEVTYYRWPEKLEDSSSSQHSEHC